MEDRIKRLETEIAYLLERVKTLEILIQNQKPEQHNHIHYEIYHAPQQDDDEYDEDDDEDYSIIG